jgi:hypothetical protein
MRHAIGRGWSLALMTRLERVPLVLVPGNTPSAPPTPTAVSGVHRLPSVRVPGPLLRATPGARHGKPLVAMQSSCCGQGGIGDRPSPLPLGRHLRGPQQSPRVGPDGIPSKTPAPHPRHRQRKLPAQPRRHRPKHPGVQASAGDRGAGGGRVVLTPPAHEAVQRDDFPAHGVLARPRRQDLGTLLTHPRPSAVRQPPRRSGLTSLSHGACHLGAQQETSPADRRAPRLLHGEVPRPRGAQERCEFLTHRLGVARAPSTPHDASLAVPGRENVGASLALTRLALRSVPRGVRSQGAGQCLARTIGPDTPDHPPLRDTGPGRTRAPALQTSRA